MSFVLSQRHIFGNILSDKQYGPYRNFLNSPISIGADSLSAQSDALGHDSSAPMHVVLCKIRSWIRIQGFFQTRSLQSIKTKSHIQSES